MKTNALAHKSIQPNILYYGTPVVLLTTKNEDGSTNISPISSSWALGDCIVMGIGYGGKAVENLRQHPECVLNLPDPSLWKQVELLAPLTGKDPVPSHKEQMGFRYEKDKFAAAGFTPMPSATVEPKRILAPDRGQGRKHPHARAQPGFCHCGSKGSQGARLRGYRPRRKLHRSCLLVSAHLQFPPLLRPGRTNGKIVSLRDLKTLAMHRKNRLLYAMLLLMKLIGPAKKKRQPGGITSKPGCLPNAILQNRRSFLQIYLRSARTMSSTTCWEAFTRWGNPPDARHPVPKKPACGQSFRSRRKSSHR